MRPTMRPARRARCARSALGSRRSGRAKRARARWAARRRTRAWADAAARLGGGRAGGAELVLEDDARVDDGPLFRTCVRRVLAELRAGAEGGGEADDSGWDVCYLYVYPDHWPSPPAHSRAAAGESVGEGGGALVADRGAWTRDGFHTWCLVAYLVSRDGAAKLARLVRERRCTRRSITWSRTGARGLLRVRSTNRVGFVENAGQLDLREGRGGMASNVWHGRRGPRRSASRPPPRLRRRRRRGRRRGWTDAAGRAAAVREWRSRRAELARRAAARTRGRRRRRRARGRARRCARSRRPRARRAVLRLMPTSFGATTSPRASSRASPRSRVPSRRH